MSRKNVRMIVVTVCVGLLVSALACVLSPIAWSPDGKWIACIHFVTKEKPQGQGDADMVGMELWIVSPSPIERRRLMATSDTLSGPTWQPDSKGIYVVQMGEKDSSRTAVWRVGLDGQRKSLVQLPRSGEGAGMSVPALSPNGQQIAFARDKSTVIVARMDGQVARTIELPDEPGNVLWSPDGRWLTVEVDGGGARPSLLFFDMRSNETFQLDARFRKLAWLPDGKRFIAMKTQGEAGGEKSFVSVFDNLTDRRETSSWPLEFKAGGPLVLSRGGEVVYLARDGEEKELSGICGLDLANGKVKTVYESAGAVCPWTLSPDGGRLAFRESGKGEGASAESVVAVLNLKGNAEPLYLAVDDKELAAVVMDFANALKKVAPGKISPSEEKIAALGAVQIERFLAAFRRDFPKSPLLEKCVAAAKEARAALQQAGVSLNPDAGAPKW